MLGKDMHPDYHYLIALGSNRSDAAHGLPQSILRAAMMRLNEVPIKILARAPIIESRPIGPSLRSYANNAVIVQSNLMPLELLHHLKAIEQDFGKRHRRRWSSRTLDLDIIMWRDAKNDRELSWQCPVLSIPHQHCRARDFVLRPASIIAQNWCDPVSGFTIGQLYHRLKKPFSKA